MIDPLTERPIDEQDALIETADAKREPRIPCCRRHSRDGKTGWCLLDDNHDGPCQVALSVPAARPDFMPWRKQ